MQDIKKIETIRRPGFRLTDKEKINLDILNFLRKKSPTSKSNISQYTGLNIVTITNYLKSYIKKGLVIERGLDVSSGGRRPELIELNVDYGFAVGVCMSLAESSATCIITNLSNNLLYRRDFNYQPEDNNIAGIEKILAEFTNDIQLDRSKIFAIGIVLENYFNNFQALAHALEKRFKIAVIVENLYAANLFSEVWNNLEEGSEKNILYFGLQDSLAMLQGEDLFLNKGIIGLNNQRTTDTKAQFCWLDKDCIFNMSDLPLRLDNPERIAQILSIRIAYLANVYGPDMIILGGGIEKFSPKLITEIKQNIKRWCFEEIAKKVKIVTSRINSDSACLGVCGMIVRDIFTKS